MNFKSFGVSNLDYKLLRDWFRSEGAVLFQRQLLSCCHCQCPGLCWVSWSSALRSLWIRLTAGWISCELHLPAGYTTAVGTQPVQPDPACSEHISTLSCGRWGCQVLGTDHLTLPIPSCCSALTQGNVAEVRNTKVVSSKERVLGTLRYERQASPRTRVLTHQSTTADRKRLHWTGSIWPILLSA